MYLACVDLALQVPEYFHSYSSDDGKQCGGCRNDRLFLRLGICLLGR